MSRKKPWLDQSRDELGRFARIKRAVRKKVPAKPAKSPAKPVSKGLRPEPKAKAKAPAKSVLKPKVKAPAKPVPKGLRPKPKAKAPAKLVPKGLRPKPKVKAPAKPVSKGLRPKPKAKIPVKAPPRKKPVKRRAKKPARDEFGRFLPKLPRPPQLPRVPEKPVPPPKKPELPHVADRSRAAEKEMQTRLLALFDSIMLVQSGLDMAVQTMINRDGTVDGELTIRNLPEEWRDERTMGLLVATLSTVLRTFVPFEASPTMGGAFWCSFGIRFGPQNEAEIGELYNLYKRHRGLFQIGTYPTPAWGTGALQIALVGDNVGLKAMLESLMEKRGLPPSVIMIRFIWTPDGERPGHYKGEKGEKGEK